MLNPTAAPLEPLDLLEVTSRQLRPVLKLPSPSARMTSAWSYRPADLAWIKEQAGLSISVCLPARNEEETIGPIVETIRSELQDDVALIDELMVVDDGSTDATALVASRAGATVIDVDQVLHRFGPGLGKGDALWRSLAASTGDIVVWCDSDIVGFGAQFVYGLIGPLLTDDNIEFVKGAFDRPVRGASGGGRVTQLLARPLLSLLRPELAFIEQPLSGSYAGRRSTLEQLCFEVDFGVDVGLLLDAADFVGCDAIAQVFLGEFRHPHRSLEELASQAESVARTIMERSNRLVAADGFRRPPLSSVPRHVGDAIDE
jgi:glucosyl-3-phosphoglycerate synthase